MAVLLGRPVKHASSKVFRSDVSADHTQADTQQTQTQIACECVRQYSQNTGVLVNVANVGAKCMFPIFFAKFLAIFAKSH